MCWYFLFCCLTMEDLSAAVCEHAIQSWPLLWREQRAREQIKRGSNISEKSSESDKWNIILTAVMFTTQPSNLSVICLFALLVLSVCSSAPPSVKQTHMTAALDTSVWDWEQRRDTDTRNVTWLLFFHSPVHTNWQCYWLVDSQKLTNREKYKQNWKMYRRTVFADTDTAAYL